MIFHSTSLLFLPPLAGSLIFSSPLDGTLGESKCPVDQSSICVVYYPHAKQPHACIVLAVSDRSKVSSDLPFPFHLHNSSTQQILLIARNKLILTFYSLNRKKYIVQQGKIQNLFVVIILSIFQTENENDETSEIYQEKCYHLHSCWA